MKTSLCANVQLKRSNFDFNLKSSLTLFFHRALQLSGKFNFVCVTWSSFYYFRFRCLHCTGTSVWKWGDWVPLSFFPLSPNNSQLRLSLGLTFTFNDKLKEAGNSFFGLGVYLLKSKFRIEGKLRFPWYYTTFSTYDQRLFSRWFPSNSCHHSNGNGQPVISRKLVRNFMMKLELFELPNLHNLCAKLGENL